METSLTDMDTLPDAFRRLLKEGLPQLVRNAVAHGIESGNERLQALGEGREWRLIETLAGEIADLVRREFGADSVAVEVKKLILPETRYVSVRVERG